jgi:hypothetical protein
VQMMKSGGGEKEERMKEWTGEGSVAITSLIFRFVNRLTNAFIDRIDRMDRWLPRIGVFVGGLYSLSSCIE